MPPRIGASAVIPGVIALDSSRLSIRVAPNLSGSEHAEQEFVRWQPAHVPDPVALVMILSTLNRHLKN